MSIQPGVLNIAEIDPAGHIRTPDATVKAGQPVTSLTQNPPTPVEYGRTAQGSKYSLTTNPNGDEIDSGEAGGGGGTPLSLVLTSSSFNNGEALPDDVGILAVGDPTSPQLSWAIAGDDVADVVEYRLSAVDTSNGSYVHWSVEDIVSTTTSIAASTDPNTSNWAGTPTINETGGGPGAAIANGWEPCAPPPGNTHVYRFTVTGHSADGTLLVTSNTLSGSYTNT